MKSFFSNIYSKLNLLRVAYKDSLLEKHTVAFVKHNENVWGGNTDHGAQGEILVEVSGMCSTVIAYSYFANVLAKLHSARIIGYSYKNARLSRPIFRSGTCKLYKSFNTGTILNVKLNRKQKSDCERLFDKIYPTLRTKRDVEDLHIKGIWIGDLLYDSHLRKYQTPTIDLQDPRFQDSLKESLQYFIFWQEYFEKHTVKAVLLSHCVYMDAIILRIAIANTVSCYQVSATHAYFIGGENAKKYNYRAYNDFIDYKKNFDQLPLEIQEKGVNLAEERIKRRFSGEIGVDMRYSTKSAYSHKVKERRILSTTDKIKILIAAHCFFDSPHPYGKNLFVDFYEWFNFLGKISEKTDYEWYIKTHPDFLPGNTEIIQSFMDKYPKFKRIPSDTSHFQIIDEGINFALTVYGTIGFEYAALGIPVITASLNNPYIAFDFNIHPKSIAEYEKTLMNLPDKGITIDKRNIFIYYYMRFVRYNTENWLFKDYKKFLCEIGGYKKQFETMSYVYFLNKFFQNNHEESIRIAKKFIDSKDYALQNKHNANSL